MLALSRKINESIMIGNDIEVTILEIKGEQVKLGIKAPRNIQILREEIFKQEGWHYELEAEDKDIEISGVVYGEMQGAFSSPEGSLEREILNSLFPDTFRKSVHFRVVLHFKRMAGKRMKPFNGNILCLLFSFLFRTYDRIDPFIRYMAVCAVHD